MALATCSSWQGGFAWPTKWGTSGKYKLICSNTNFVFNGNAYPQGRVSDPINNNWCFIGDITVVGNVPTFSSWALPQTDVGITGLNGSGAQVEPTYTLIIYSNGGRVRRNALFQNWRIGQSLTTTFNFAALASYNDAVTVVNPRPRFLDEDEVNNLITARLNAPASTTQLGIVEVDVTPVDTTRPVVVGANSYASTSHRGIARASVAPVSATDPIFFGDNDPRAPTQTLRDAMVGSYGTPSTSNPYVTTLDRRLLHITDVTQAGVVADAVVSTDGVINSASSSFSSASHPATSADANKKIVIYGAGSLSATSGLNNALRTTVSTNSGSNYTLAAAASASVSGARWVYGTDNTAAVQAILTGFSLTGAGGVLFFPPGSYVLGSCPLPAGNITVRAMPGTVTIYSTANSVFTFDGRSNVTVEGIGIDACGNPLGNGAVTLVGGTGVSNIRVARCRFVDTFLTNNVAPVATFSRHGVLTRDSSDVWILDNYFETALRIKAAGGTVGEQRTYIVGNILRNTNENGISLLTGQATTVRDVFVLDNTVDGIMATGDGIVMGDDGGGGASQQFINITINGNTLKGLLPANTAYIQDKGTGVAKNISISFNKFDNSTGTNQGQTFAVNKANQGTTSQTANFQAVGNQAVGYYDVAVYRFGNIASGVIADNTADAAANSQRGIRLGTVSNLKVHHNTIAGCSYGIYFSAGTLSNLEVGHNTVTLPASNGAAGVYMEATVTPPALTFFRNTIVGAGGSYTNVYAFEDATNGVGGVTDAVKYLYNDISNINTTLGLGSRWYQTLPAHAIVIDVEGSQVLSVTTGATPDVRGKSSATFSYSGATNVTNLLNGYDGQTVKIRWTTNNGVLKVGAGFALAGAADFVGTADDTATVQYAASTDKWYQVSGSVN